jgi:hypothetical protein
MSMQKSYCNSMRYSGPESLALRDQTKFDVLIQVEVLSGCVHSCTGCFVNKHNPIDVEGPLLEEAKRLADGVKKAGLNLREFVIGPTDFFSASNTESVLNNQITQDILREHTNVRIATPAKFDLVSDDKFARIFKILDDPAKFREDMIIEFVMPIEKPDTMLNNTKYFDSVMDKVEYFKYNTPKQIDWSWTLQSSSILSKNISKAEYNQILDKSVNEYETILEMNPAFSRAPKHKQKENLKSWNGYLKSVVDTDNFDKVTMSMANLNCNSMNFIGLTVIMGKTGPETHLNVMLHEQAFFITNERTNVTGLSFEEILDRRNSLILEGIENLSKHPLYKDTPYVISMANRLLWEAILAMELTEEEEVLPMDVLSLYNPTEEGSHLWNEDALKKVTYRSGAA